MVCHRSEHEAFKVSNKVAIIHKIWTEWSAIDRTTKP